MPIVQANVPIVHLATAMGAPNQLLIEYQSDVLLPVAGPHFVQQFHRSLLRPLLMLSELLQLIELVQQFVAAGRQLDIKQLSANEVGRRVKDSYGRDMLPGARQALRVAPQHRTGTEARIERLIYEMLSRPNTLVREAFELRLLARNQQVLNVALQRSRTLAQRCQIVLAALMPARRAGAPQNITQNTRRICANVMRIASQYYPNLVRAGLLQVPAATRTAIYQWMIASAQSSIPPLAAPFTFNLGNIFGFTPNGLVSEWAIGRRERLRLEFGSPTLRGPVNAEPVGPQGVFRREDYISSRLETVLATNESRREQSRETFALTVGAFRRELESIYYSGAGTVQNLTGAAADTLMSEERRERVLSLIREVSERRERASINVSSQETSSTISREARGVDPRLAATHHRFKVVVPVTATAEYYDATLTWCPRVLNPFFALRKAIAEAYETAFTSHLAQYYVPEPVSPAIVWDKYIVTDDVNIEEGNLDGAYQQTFRTEIPQTDREDHPDLSKATVVWNQSESFWNDDPDHYAISLRNLSYSGGTVTGKVRLETDDGGSDFQGYAHIEIPVLRYSQDTVNALAAHEVALQDYQLKRQALMAQAHQYARIKQREFIERHEDRGSLLKVAFYALAKRICLPWLGPQASYYKEILWRCIDWNNARLELEPARMDALAYPDFGADHFANSLWCRFFLPVHRTAETNFLDALDACGTFYVRQSVQVAANQIAAARARLAQGPIQVNQFATEMTIGEHIEAVMSNRELST